MDDIHPLSFEQRDYLSRGHTGFGTIAACSEVTGPLDVTALKEAAECVVRTHETLRMRLLPAPDGFNQKFEDPQLTDVRLTESFSVDLADLYRQSTEKINADKDGRVWLKVLHENESHSYVITLLDHLACDGWSAFLFLEQLWRAYLMLVKGVPPEIPAPRLPYSGYVAAQRKWSRSRRSVSSKSYWDERATDFAMTDSGLRLIGPVIANAGRSDLVAEIDAGRIDDIRQMASMLDVSVNVIPMGCLMLAAWSMTGEDSAGISFIYSGRDDPRTRLAVGLFRRYVPVVAEKISERKVADFFGELAKAQLAAIQWSRAPFSAAEFEATVSGRRRACVADILFNQMDVVFGEQRRNRSYRVGPETLVRFLDDPHFSTIRWQEFSEPRLRVVLSGGGHPVLRAIFNEGCLSGQDVSNLLTRTVTLIENMRPESCVHRIPELVTAALNARG